MYTFISPLPATVDTPPALCSCGRPTVESHDFWFCSTECARSDALRSLENPTSHYRDAVHDAHVRAGVPMVFPRRTRSAYDQSYPTNGRAPPYPPNSNAPIPGHPRVILEIYNPNLTRHAPGVHNAAPAPLPPPPPPHPTPGGHPYPQISLDRAALPVDDGDDEFPMRRPPRRIPSIDHIKRANPTVAGLMDRFRRKPSEVEHPQKAFGHVVDPVPAYPPPRKDARKVGKGF